MKKIISQLNKNRYKLGNKYLSVESNQENVPQSAKEGFSQADVIVDNSINIVKNIDGVMNQMGLKNTDNDIIKKAMLEHLIVKDLIDSKNENKIGIEEKNLNHMKKHYLIFMKEKMLKNIIIKWCFIFQNQLVKIEFY